MKLFFTACLCLLIAAAASAKDFIKPTDGPPISVQILLVEGDVLSYKDGKNSSVLYRISAEQIDYWTTTNKSIIGKACVEDSPLCKKHKAEMQYDEDEVQEVTPPAAVSSTFNKPALTTAINLMNTPGYHIEQAGRKMTKAFNYEMFATVALITTGAVAASVEKPVPVLIIGGAASVVLAAVGIVAQYESASHLRIAGQLSNRKVSLNLSPVGGSLVLGLNKPVAVPKQF